MGTLAELWSPLKALMVGFIIVQSSVAAGAAELAGGDPLEAFLRNAISQGGAFLSDSDSVYEYSWANPDLMRLYGNKNFVLYELVNLESSPGSSPQTVGQGLANFIDRNW